MTEHHQSNGLFCNSGHALQGFPFDDFDLHDVMLPEDEGDFGYASDDDEIDEEEVVTETGFGSVIGERMFLHCPLLNCIARHIAVLDSSLSHVGSLSPFSPGNNNFAQGARHALGVQSVLLRVMRPLRVARCAVVDNLPKVAAEKFGKLETYIQKVYSQIGSISSEGGFYMPVDPETKMSKGYAFVEFSNPQVGHLTWSLHANCTICSHAQCADTQGCAGLLLPVSHRTQGILCWAAAAEHPSKS